MLAVKHRRRRFYFVRLGKVMRVSPEDFIEYRGWSDYLHD